ncbi:MAG: phosphoenolpyruvate--protein phosphotransferase [Pseudomonadota bacterium]
MNRGSLAGPRLLLRRLREVMAEPIGAQERLDKIVSHIAANMVAEVCSVYILRADGILELFATEGLKPEAVHNAGLRVGVGLVGVIADEARPLNLRDAQSHPSFAYLPETGEEEYHSFLGVPVLRAGRTLGVLVVQNRSHRSYVDEEMEAMQTTAMVIAEMIATGELQGLQTLGSELDLKRAIALQGIPMSEGIGLGHVVLHEPRIVVRNLIAEDVDVELERLETAIREMRLSVDDMLARGEIAHMGEHREVLEAYRMFAHDRGWVSKLEDAVRNGLTAEAAVERVQSDTRARMMRQRDPYLRERLHDLDDLANRLLRILVAREDRGEERGLFRDTILVARTMGPTELLDYDLKRLRGVILEDGGPTSHVAIVAKALGLAAVGRLNGIVSLVEAGDPVIIDGDAGEVHVRPQSDVETAYSEKVRLRARRQAQYRRLKNKPSITMDGTEVTLMINAGLPFDMPHLEETGARGVGLFRTELQFMISSSLPRMGDQRLFYEKILEDAGERPVVFRTLDVGGDKVLPYLQAAPEENPALGWRAIRLGLDRPALFRTQIRALLRAAAGRELRVMVPMVADVNEVRRARELVEREIRFARRHNHAIAESIRLGAMLEVPALLFQLEELMTVAQFVSVGTNDLFQFMMAADRGNPRVSSRFDPLSPSFLRALKKVADAAREAHIPLTLCGEIAGRPLEAMALMAIGYRSLSMSPAGIGPVKAMVLQLDLAKLRARLLPRLEPSDRDTDIRQFLARFADNNGLSI